MQKNKKSVLVAGANGTTGRIIVDLLKKSNSYEPIAMVRKKEQKEHFEDQQVATVLADLEEEIPASMINADKVIFAAGSGGEKVVAVDQEGAKKLIDASKKAGVQKLVMLSSMGADNPSQSEAMQAYLEAKQNADHYLSKSGLLYSIVRPGQLTNDAGTGTIYLEQSLGKMGKIPRADVAKTLVEVLGNKVKSNEVFEIISGDTRIEKAVQ